MPTTVEIKDQGVSIDFPDSMSQDDIRGVLRRKFGPSRTGQPGPRQSAADEEGSLADSDEAASAASADIQEPTPPGDPAANVATALTHAAPVSYEAMAAQGNVFPLSKVTEPLAKLVPKASVETMQKILTLPAQLASEYIEGQPDTEKTPIAEKIMAAAPSEKAVAITTGIEHSVADTANFFTSPLGIATLGMGALPKAAQSAVSLAFAVQMGTEVPELAKELGEELGKPEDERDYQKISNLTANAIVQTGFTAAGALHAAHPLVEKTGATPGPAPAKNPLAQQAESIKPVAPLTAAALEHQAEAISPEKPEGIKLEGTIEEPLSREVVSETSAIPPAEAPLEDTSPAAPAAAPTEPRGEAGAAPATEKPTIRAAAIRMPDGKIFTGVIHAEAIEKAVEAGYKEDGAEFQNAENGFVTKSGDFVDPSKAYNIAVDSGSIDSGTYNDLLKKNWGSVDFGDGLEASTFEDAKFAKEHSQPIPEPSNEKGNENASSEPEATALHGDVQPLEESARELPAEEGERGVQPEAEVRQTPERVRSGETEGDAGKAGEEANPNEGVEPETTTHFDPAKVQTVEVPVTNIKLSKDVPNFKESASEETGVVSGQELEGTYERLGTGPIVVWKRLNGDLEVITGRHRLDLARRSGEKTIPAQVVEEAKGFTRDMALTFDAESNIRDGQGSVEDYAHYFKLTPGLAEAEAKSRGLLSRAKGKAGWDLARAASDDLYALWKSGKVSEAQAVAAARAAPGNPEAQQIGAKFALQGKSPEFVSNVIKASLAESKARGQTMDLFGNDDAAMQQMAEQADKAASIQRGLREQISAVSGAAKKPEVAKKMGVDVNDPEAVRAKMGELKAQLERWENWPLHSDLVEMTKGVESRAKVEAKTEKEAAYGDIHQAARKAAREDIARSGLRSEAKQVTTQGPGQTGSVMRREWDSAYEEEWKKADAERAALVNPPQKGSGELFQASETPFNLTGEKAVEMVEPKVEKTGYGNETLAQDELFGIQKVVESKDPGKSADAAQKLYGGAKAAIAKLENQLRVVDSDPQTRKAFSKEQRGRLKDVIALLRQREATEPKIVGMGGAIPEEFERGKGSATSIKNATVDQERVKRGLPPAMEPARRSFGEVWDRAMARMDKDPGWQDGLINDLREHPRALNDEENAALLQRQIDLQNQYGRATRDLAQAYDDAKEFPNRLDEVESGKLEVARLSDQLQDIYDIGKKAGTEGGRGLNARKMLANEDFTLAKMQMEKRLANDNWRGLTDKQIEQHQAEVGRLQKLVEDTQKRLDEYDAKGEAAKKAVDATIADLQRDLANEQAATQKYRSLIEQFAAPIHREADAARARIKERLSRMSAGVDPTLVSDLAIVGMSKILRGAAQFEVWSAGMLKEFGEKIKPHLKEVWDKSHADIEERAKKHTPGVAEAVKKVVGKKDTVADVKEKIERKLNKGKKDEITPLAQRLTRLFLEQGIKGREAVWDAVHNVISEIDPTITKRETADMMSGYGDYRPLSKDEISREQRAIKGELQQIAKLEDIMAKRPIKKTGPERREKGDEERRLEKQVNEAKKKYGVVVTDPERQLKSALDARKTYLRNRMADLKHEIETGEKIVKTKSPPPTDAELEGLKREYNALKEEHVKVFPKEGITDEQRVKMATAAIEKSITEYERRIKEKELSTPRQMLKTPSTPDLESLRAHREQLKGQLEELRASDSAYQEQKVADQLRDSIQEYQRRLKAGDLFDKEKPTAATTPTIDALKAQRDDLRQQLAEARKKSPQGQAKVEDQKAKAIEDRIAEVERRIRDNDLGARAKPAVADSPRVAALKVRLKTARDSLQRLRESGVYDAERLAKAKEATRSAVDELERRINEGDIAAKSKGATGPTDPELEQMRAERKDLSKILQELRNAEKPKMTPEERTLKSLKTRLKNRTAELQDKLARGDFTTKPRNVTPLDPEATRLKVANEKAKLDWHRGLAQDRLKQRSRPQKLADLLLRIRREFTISGISALLLKLPGYSAMKFGEAPLRDVVAGGISKLPLVRDIASQSPSEAPRGALGKNVRDLAGDYVSAFTKGIRDAKESWKGDSDLKTLYDPSIRPEGEFRTFFGRLHQMEKSPLIRFKFEQSFRRRMEFGVAHGEDITDPSVMQRHGVMAYADALNEALVNKNDFVRKVDRFVNSFAEKNKVTGRVPTSGKVLQFAYGAENPVKHVPANYVARTLDYVLGLARGGIEMRGAFKRGLSELKPEEANQIMRHLTSGLIGNAVIALGFLAPQVFGGLWHPGRKDEQGKLKPGEIGTPLGTVPAAATHNPLMNAAQFGATVRQVSESKLKKADKVKAGLTAGAQAAAWGLVDETPYMKELLEFTKALDPRLSGSYLGQKLRGYAVPSAVQQTAQYFDTDINGNPIKRQPKGAVENLKMGVPGLRQTVPVAKKK